MINDNLSITIVSNDVNKTMFENYIKNEHLKKIKIYETFTKKLTTDFKFFCDQLQNNIIDIIIKYTIAEHCDEDVILQDLYNQKLSDFTIQFSDGTNIKCLKGLLRCIPYFSNMFEDTDVQDVIILDYDPYTVQIVIDSLYHQNTITIENVCNVVKLMDMWLMNFNIDLSFIDQNLDKILLNKEEDIVILVNNLKKTNFDLTKIYRHNFKNIFLFDDWKNIFTDKQKINAIKSSGKYEYLNTISLQSVLPLLLEISKNDELDKLIDQLLIMACHNMAYCNSNIIQLPKIFVVIDDYYPIFNATIYTQSNIEIEAGIPTTHYYEDNIFYNIYPSIHVNVNQDILIGNDISSMYNDSDYINRIVSIEYNNKNIPQIYYSLYEDTEIVFDHHPYDGMIWCINKYQFKID